MAQLTNANVRHLARLIHAYGNRRAAHSEWETAYRALPHVPMVKDGAENARRRSDDALADIMTYLESLLRDGDWKMTANMADIVGWFNNGVERGATHMIVVCDTYDWEDYPVYVLEGQDVRALVTEYSGKEMQRIMEVYNLLQDRDAQLAQPRAFNF